MEYNDADYYWINGRGFRYDRPIDQVVEITKIPPATVKRLRLISLRNATHWDRIPWDTLSIEEIAAKQEVSVDDVREIRKMLLKEKNQWTNLDYSLSDEELAAQTGFSTRTIHTYRKYFDKNFAERKNAKKKDLAVSVRMKKELKQAIDDFSKIANVSPSEFIRLVLANIISGLPKELSEASSQLSLDNDVESFTKMIERIKANLPNSTR